MINYEIIKSEIDKTIDKLAKTFIDKGENYFFTEKEIHSYFYHLCQLSDVFDYKDYSLIHTEYPTPYKCSIDYKSAKVTIEPRKSRKRRAHIDFVVINPRFIDFVLDTESDKGIIYGISDALFSDYIPKFKNIYKDFFVKFQEPILIYALEFKFLRHSWAGEKYPILDVILDINKLKLLKILEIDGTKINFVGNIRSLVYIGYRHKGIEDKIKKETEEYRDICQIICH